MQPENISLSHTNNMGFQWEVHHFPKYKLDFLASNIFLVFIYFIWT